MPTYYYKGGVRIEIRTRENGHNEPHVHAVHAGEDMSVSIVTGAILAGDLSNRKAKRLALACIEENMTELLREWRKYHV